MLLQSIGLPLNRAVYNWLAGQSIIILQKVGQVLCVFMAGYKIYYNLLNL
jgi:hypothetical protein